MIRIDGSLYFGSVDYVQKEMARLVREDSKHLIIIAKGINFMDISGVHLLEAEILNGKKVGREVRVCSLKGTVLDEIQSMTSFQSVLKYHLSKNSKEAIAGMLMEIDKEQCRHCPARIFNECTNFPVHHRSPKLL
ncbi:sodium-independent anion transporter [Marinomonas sp. GJ51-6]|uniref:sodium-independent anion transporter n=1 Tax=Marinomonas sp. GJ51-6 TaxID=2992802 RepID=UPI00293416F4|nr:sodium-independent anion transporter [Marinomonas sp. GJ51-6]WOD09299.1 sodium-independent anion transporter [Marinomonas sp. GJ51-6]